MYSRRALWRVHIQAMRVCIWIDKALFSSMWPLASLVFQGSVSLDAPIYFLAHTLQRGQLSLRTVVELFPVTVCLLTLCRLWLLPQRLLCHLYDV